MEQEQIFVDALDLESRISAALAVLFLIWQKLNYKLRFVLLVQNWELRCFIALCVKQTEY